ncbi:hypothetical protein FRC11_005054 [Ceratobasidium sp. 423]|nr:hypothetical protein FRC11_005054 [Ceratobasidium sp. 423]
MSLHVKSKQAATIVLIGDNATSKLNLTTFIDAVCTGKNAEEFLNSTTTVSSQSSPTRTISCTDSTQLNIASYPESLSTNEHASAEDVLAWLKQWTTTIDAFVILVDSSKSAIDAGTTATLETLSFIFPRRIQKNVFFLFFTTDPNGTSSIDVESTQGLPSWLSPDNIVLLEDLVVQRKNVQDRIQAKQGAPATLRQLFTRKFGYGMEDLQKMLESVDQSVVQAYDSGHLYMRATAIESQIYTSLGEGSGAALGNEALQKIYALVNEYCLIAQSPDFSTHVELVSALLRGSSERGVSGMDNTLSKLTEVRSALRVLETGNEKYPKGFVVY